MARITVEDCMRNVNNRFALVLVSSRRSRQILKGSRPLVKSTNKPIVTSLREIAARKILIELPDQQPDRS